MDEQKKPEPDYGSTLAWSDDDSRNVKWLLEKYNGNVAEAIKRFFVSGGTDYATARSLSVRFAPAFGITDVEFMKLYRQWRRGKL